MESMLIVSGAAKATQGLIELLKPYNLTAHLAENSAEARREMLQQEFDCVLINTPLKDEFGWELATIAAQKSTSGILLLVKGELAEEIGGEVEEYGVVVLPKPFSRAAFHQALRWMNASQNRLLQLKKQNFKLQKQMEDLRLISRAKCILIQKANLTEQQAHHYIEKQAMDMRMTKREVALSVIRTYENE